MLSNLKEKFKIYKSYILQPNLVYSLNWTKTNCNSNLNDAKKWGFLINRIKEDIKSI